MLADVLAGGPDGLFAVSDLGAAPGRSPPGRARRWPSGQADVLVAWAAATTT
jgi:hypothetical protein